MESEKNNMPTGPSKAQEKMFWIAKGPWVFFNGEHRLQWALIFQSTPFSVSFSLVGSGLAAVCIAPLFMPTPAWFHAADLLIRIPVSQDSRSRQRAPIGLGARQYNDCPASCTCCVSEPGRLNSNRDFVLCCTLLQLVPRAPAPMQHPTHASARQLWQHLRLFCSWTHTDAKIDGRLMAQVGALLWPPGTTGRCFQLFLVWGGQVGPPRQVQNQCWVKSVAAQS